MDINSKEFNDILLNTHNEFRKHTAMWGQKKEIEAICERTGVDKNTARQALFDMEHPYGKEWLKDKEREEQEIRKEIREEKKAKKEERRDKFFAWCEDYSAKANTARCPKCHSTSISYDTKKLSVGRAIVGSAVAGPTGAILGGLSSKKGYAVCLKCGKRWKI